MYENNVCKKKGLLYNNNMTGETTTMKLEKLMEFQCADPLGI